MGSEEMVSAVVGTGEIHGVQSHSNLGVVRGLCKSVLVKGLIEGLSIADSTTKITTATTNDNDDDDNDDNDASTTSHVQRHGLDDLDAGRGNKKPAGSWMWFNAPRPRAGETE